MSRDATATLTPLHLAQRVREPEVMDDPALDAGEHIHALEGLARLNRWSASARILWAPLAGLARELGAPVRVLDLATGAGDLPVHLWRRAQRAHLSLTVDGCDRSPRSVAHAQTRADRAHAGLHFFPLDALQDPLPIGYDVIMCSLFTHHLDSAQVVELFRRMRSAARRLVLVSDLARSAAGWWLAYLGSRLLTRSSVVHRDALLSVRAAYQPQEIRALAADAGLQGARVQRRWPYRWLLTWRNA